jgi:hypothetical protein
MKESMADSPRFVPLNEQSMIGANDKGQRLANAELLPKVADLDRGLFES